MADAQVLTPDQIQKLLAAQQSQASNSSSTPLAAAAPCSSNRLKTSFKKRRSFEPFYTGGATAVTPDGALLFATLNDQVCVVQVSTGNVVQRLAGDTEEVTALTVSPSGSHLVVASRSLSLSIYTLPECKLVRNLAKSHQSQVNLMSIDPTSTLLATGGSDGVAKVWDIERGFCTHAFKGHAGVVSALAWNMPPCSSTSNTTSKKNKSKSKASSDNTATRIIQLLTGSVDGKVRVWDLNNPAELHKPVATLTGHDSVVRGIAVTEDGATLVTGSRDRTLVVWRLPASAAANSSAQAAAGWKQAETLSANEGIESVGFLPATSLGEQQVFWTGGSDGILRLWDVASSTIIAKEPKTFNEQLAHYAKQQRAKRASAAGRTVDHAYADDEETRAIMAVHLVSNALGPQLVSVHADQNIVVRSAGGAAGARLNKVRQLIGFNDEIVDLALLSCTAIDHTTVQETHLAVATNSRSLRVYTLGGADGDETTAELLAGHTDIVLCLDKSPDMRLLASGAKDKTTRIWAYVPTWRLSTCLGSEQGADDGGVKISRHTTSISNASAGSHVEQGEWVCVGICEGHAESVGAIAFARRASSPGAPYSPFIVTASQDRTVKIWDLSPVNTLLSSTQPIAHPIQLKSLVTQRVHEKDINCLDISPNNAMLATGSQDRTAKILSLSFSASSSKSSAATARLTTLATLKGHKRGIWACRFSPVDLALATASGDKTVRLWSLKTFTSVKLFEGHTNSVLKLSFLSAGMQLASCAGDGLVKIWNVKDEECTSTIDAHDDKVWSIAVSSDESWMVSAAADGSIRAWEDRTEEEKEEKRQQREDEVRMEQQFGNMLVDKDWRNAIALALQMAQPRRLLGLFTHVSQCRPQVERAKRNALLTSALQVDSDDDQDEHMIAFEQDDEPLRAAGIPTDSRPHRPRNASTNAHSQSDASCAADADANSITGLASIDSILSTLPPNQLIQLLLYIRDWNTSTRTAPIAQTVLHAILSTHTASSLISIFDSASKSHRAALAERLENEELGIVAPLAQKESARQRRLQNETKVDLASLVEALLPYTERHWQRADRVLIEASMLEYSVQAMDTLLGFDQDDDDAAEQNTFADQLRSASVQDEHVDMSDDDSL